MLAIDYSKKIAASRPLTSWTEALVKVAGVSLDAGGTGQIGVENIEGDLWTWPSAIDYIDVYG